MRVAQVQYCMNVAFVLILISSICMMLATSPSLAFPTMIEGVSGAISLALKLCAIYTVWLSVLKMMQATGLDKALSRIVKPIVKRLFKNENDDAYKWISINLASNMLGMGGAATPAGIKAMSEMQDGSDKASDNMILLLVINATSVQLIPATIIAILASNDAKNAAGIIFPTFISSLIATAFGVILCKTLGKATPKHNSTTFTNNDNKRSLSSIKRNIKCHFCNFGKNKDKQHHNIKRKVKDE